jgi:hypothetical protein
MERLISYGTIIALLLYIAVQVLNNFSATFLRFPVQGRVEVPIQAEKHSESWIVLKAHNKTVFLKCLSTECLALKPNDKVMLSCFKHLPDRETWCYYSIALK